jgi:hypothetical protein
MFHNAATRSIFVLALACASASCNAGSRFSNSTQDNEGASTLTATPRRNTAKAENDQTVTTRARAPNQETLEDAGDLSDSGPQALDLATLGSSMPSTSISWPIRKEHNSGQHALAKGNAKDALLHLRAVYEHAPDWPLAAYDLGLAEERFGDTKRGLKLLVTALKADYPRFAETWRRERLRDETVAELSKLLPPATIRRKPCADFRRH